MYSYPPGGVALPRTALDAGSYVCVPSTFEPWQGAFEIVVYAPAGCVGVEPVSVTRS